MRKIHLTFLVFIVFINSLFAQNLSGTISDNEGKPVPFATVFIRELKLGTITNEQGQYSLNVKSGKYSIVYQSLGYETVEKSIDIKDGNNKVDAKLNAKNYQIKEVVVKPGSEDPAYPIIRKAIGMAPYYLNQVKEFEAEVYLKGTFKIIKLMWLVKRAMKDEKDAPKEGQLYLTESVNNIHFVAPDKYDQTVKMMRSNFPSGGGDGNDAMQFVNASLYDSKIGEIILPLSPYALNNYNFRYEGYSKEKDRIINKIKVTPKRKSKQLVEGYIYIADKYWNLHSANLTVESIVGTINIQQTFGEVEDNIWLPINYTFDINGKFMGNEGNVKYVSSVKYKTVNINSDIKTPSNLVSKSVQKKLEETSQQQVVKTKPKSQKEVIKEQKRKEKIEKLLEKDELSNKDMYQLATLMAKDAKEADTTKKTLELKDNYKVKVDSLARKADTTVWNQIRPIALNTDELRGMEELRISSAKKDSANNKKDTLKKKSIFSKIVFGHSNYDKKTKRYYSYSGIVDFEQLRFNTVDGFVTGLSFTYNKPLKKRSISITPKIAYAFNRDILMGGVSGGFSHSASRRGYFGISAGSESVDFNRESGVNTFANSVASLAFRTNYMKLYEHQYAEIWEKIDIINGFESSLRLGYYNRTMLENTTDFSFYPKDKNTYTPNLPINDTIYGRYTPNHKAFIAKLSLSYTPEYFYRMYNDRKYMVSSKYPTFTLDSKFGIPGIAGSDVKFLQVEVGVKQSIKFGPSNRFSYKVGYGDFLIKDKVYFPDYKHFNTQEIPVLIGDFASSYQFLKYYENSTTSSYAQGFMKLTSPYLALKFLPWVSNRMWNENLYASTLYLRGGKPYWELGYSITEIGIFGGVGVFVGFEGDKFYQWGVKASIKFDGEVSI